MAEAMDKVFGSTELLESVLLQLPQIDLLLAQAVCVAWKESIRVSPKIQQKLFFQPTTNLAQEPELSPLLLKLFPLFFTLEKCPVRYGYLLYGLPQIRATVPELRQLEWFCDDRRRNAVLRDDASWRKMFPVQPPAPIDKVVKGGGCDAYECIEHGVIEPVFQHLQHKGARMGLIYDIILQQLVENLEAGVHIEWQMFSFSRHNEDESEEADEEGAEKILESTITIHVDFPCHCDCRYEDDERYVATPLQIARCDEDMFNWDTILESND
jgi:hypothetical protein